MKTFSLDSLGGELNQDIKWIEEQTRDKLEDVIEFFIKSCIQNDVEMTSSEGMLLDLVFQEITRIRFKEVAVNNISTSSQ